MFSARIKGSPIAADPNPNTTQPPPDRVTRVGMNKSKKGGTRTLFLYLLDGTSLDVTVWIKVDRGASSDPVWFRFGTAGSTVLSKVVSTVSGVPADMAAVISASGTIEIKTEVFLQVTNPTGNPTQLGYSFVDE